MKQIESIASVNLKGRNFRHALHSLTVIAGDNATGKTAITDAIQIALLGYHPNLGKKPGATMELAPSDSAQMEIEATFSEGGKVRRSFTRTRSGAGLETIGTAPSVQPAQLNFSEFLNAKPTERHAILSSLMGQIDYAELSEKVKAKMATLGLLEIIQITIDPQAEKPLDAAITSLADHAREIKQSVDQNRKTLASMGMVESPISVPQEQLSSAEKALAVANETVGKYLAELDQLNREIEKSPDEPCDPEPSDDERAALLAAAETATRRLAEAKAASSQRGELEARLQAFQNHYPALASKAKNATGTEPKESLESVRELQEAMGEKIRDAVSPLNRASSAAGAAEQEINTTTAQLKQLQHGSCPCCGNTGVALEAAMEAMVARQTAASQNWIDSKAERAALEERLEADKKRHRELVELEKQIQAWQAKNELQDLDKQIADVREKIASEPDIKALEIEVKKAAAAIAAANAVEGEWKQYRAAAIPTKDQLDAALLAHRQALEGRTAAAEALAQMRSDNAAFAAWQSDQNRAAIMQDETEKLEKTSAGIGQLRAFLVETQRDAVAASMKPLISTAGIFLEGLIQGEMATDAHRVGIRRDGAFLPLEVLSGMEMLAVSAACQAALASQSEIRILLVDEMARMTAANRETFTRNCKTAIEAGVIDQAILVDQTPPPRGDIHTILV